MGPGEALASPVIRFFRYGLSFAILTFGFVHESLGCARIIRSGTGRGPEGRDNSRRFTPPLQRLLHSQHLADAGVDEILDGLFPEGLDALGPESAAKPLGTDEAEALDDAGGNFRYMIGRLRRGNKGSTPRFLRPWFHVNLLEARSIAAGVG